jgi:hypothetical protein
MTTQQQGRSLFDLVVDYTSAIDVPRRRRLAEFLDVQEQTIRSWQRRKSVPGGVRALKMHYLLEQMGQVNSEWRITDQAVVEVGKLIAFKVLPIEALIAEFKDKGVDEQNAVRMLCGHKHIKAENMAVFQRLMDTLSDKLDGAIASWSDLMVRDPRDQLVSELANRLIAVLPLCEQMITDDWTAEERHELRQRCGQETVFKLYNALGALCGEKARQHTLKTAAAGLLVR